jgi:hypothetical protein
VFSRKHASRRTGKRRPSTHSAAIHDQDMQAGLSSGDRSSLSFRRAELTRKRRELARALESQLPQVGEIDTGSRSTQEHDENDEARSGENLSNRIRTTRSFNLRREKIRATLEQAVHNVKSVAGETMTTGNTVRWSMDASGRHVPILKAGAWLSHPICSTPRKEVELNEEDSAMVCRRGLEKPSDAHNIVNPATIVAHTGKQTSCSTKTKPGAKPRAPAKSPISRLSERLKPSSPPGSARAPQKRAAQRTCRPGPETDEAQCFAEIEEWQINALPVILPDAHVRDQSISMASSIDEKLETPEREKSVTQNQTSPCDVTRAIFGFGSAPPCTLEDRHHRVDCMQPLPVSGDAPEKASDAVRGLLRTQHAFKAHLLVRLAADDFAPILRDEAMAKRVLEWVQQEQELWSWEAS